MLMLPKLIVTFPCFLFLPLQDGTVGEDLVVRPLPASLHQAARGEVMLEQKEEEVNENHLAPPDDEFFIDEVEDLGDQMVFSDGLPLSADDTSTGSLLDLQQMPSVPTTLYLSFYIHNFVLCCISMCLMMFLCDVIYCVMLCCDVF